MGGDTAPQPLRQLTAKFCISNLTTTLSTPDCPSLRPGIVLPNDICERLLDVAVKDDESFDTQIVPLFEDPTRTRLKSINVRNGMLSDMSLAILMRHLPQELDIHGCTRLTPHTLETINRHGKNLNKLNIGSSSHILPDTLLQIDGVTPTAESAPYRKRGYILDTPNLRQLVLWSLQIQHETEYWPILIQNYQNLTHLDLSNCNIDELDFLRNCDNLISLILYNVQVSGHHFDVLKDLTKLRHLDISQSSDNTSIFHGPNELLASLILNIPNLKSLDISGTNLAGRGVGQSLNSSCDIVGLSSRVSNPLEFLGLYNTHHDASHRHHIPAKLVAGDQNEEQILVACQAYMERHEILEKVLNDLFHLFRAEKGKNIQHALNLILEAMKRHLGEKHVQISGSASLFYIVKQYEGLSHFTEKSRRSVLTSLIEAMEVHKFDSTMMRNGCLTICLFKIPADVLFKYERLVNLLLSILGAGAMATQEDFVERVAIYLLNSLACQVEGVHKQLVGDLGAIEKMLSLIQERLNKTECDDVMEIAWSTMWNVTDETPQNCERFLQGHGMGLFLSCLNTFPNKPELLRNMMGLLGNVAEVERLRPDLMTFDFVHVFNTLLDSTQDNIEVSYNAAGVLAHILSDGEEAWTIEMPTRGDVVANMARNIGRWDIDSQRNINYRSFEPILRLLTVGHTAVCQLWASWALANLTKVYPHKYCPLLVKEGGIQLLQPLILHPLVGHFASLSLDHVQQFRAARAGNSSSSTP